MPSENHNFIVAAISRRIRQQGFKITYLDGKYQYIDINKFEIPPKIINHKPDIIAEKDNASFCIGEAKTKSDIFSERTKNQIIDFLSAVKLNSANKLFIGIPLNAKEDLNKLLFKLGIVNQPQVEIIYIPERLLPNEEEL